MRNAKTPPGQSPDVVVTRDHDDLFEGRSLPAPTPSPLTIRSIEEPTEGNSSFEDEADELGQRGPNAYYKALLSNPNLSTAERAELIHEERCARCAAAAIPAPPAGSDSLRFDESYARIAPAASPPPLSAIGYAKVNPYVSIEEYVTNSFRADSRIEDIDVPMEIVPVRHDLEKFLAVNKKADDLAVRPTTAKLKVSDLPFAFGNMIPESFEEDVIHHYPHPWAEERTPFRNPDKQKLWIPVANRRLAIAHIARTNALVREGKSRFSAAEDDDETTYETIYRGNVPSTDANHADEMERSWKQGDWTDRLMPAFKERMDTWDRRMEGAKAANAPPIEFAQLTNLESEAVGALASWSTHPPVDYYAMPAIPIEPFRDSVIDEGAEIARQRAEEPSSTRLQLEGRTLDPLLRIARHPDDRDAVREQGSDENWAIRGGPPSPKMKADQQKVARLATLLWEEVEEKPSTTKASDLTKPLWARMTMHRIVEDDCKERRGPSDNRHLQCWKSPDLDKYANLGTELEKAGLAKQEEWLNFTDKWMKDEPAQGLAAGEEYECLAEDLDASDAMWLEPDQPQGVFDVVEVQYYVDRERQTQIKKKRSQGTSKDDLEAWHQERFGMTIAEMYEQAQQVKEKMVQMRKLLPPVPPKPAKPTTARKRKAATALDDPPMPTRKSARRSEGSQETSDKTASEKKESPVTVNDTAITEDLAVEDTLPATVSFSARELTINISSTEQSPMVIDNDVARDDQSSVSNNSLTDVDTSGAIISNSSAIVSNSNAIVNNSNAIVNTSNTILSKSSMVVNNTNATAPSLIVKFYVEPRILRGIVTGTIRFRPDGKKTRDLWGL